MIKYKTTNSYVEIHSVEVSKETALSVWVKNKHGETRQQKSSSWCVFHDTWQQAKDYLVARETQRVEGLRLQLERAKGALGNAKGLREPE